MGFDANDPHNQLGNAGGSRWVTGAPGGFPSDFIAVAGEPILTFERVHRKDRSDHGPVP